MKKLTFTTTKWGNIERISKKKAFSLYHAGFTVLLQSCNFTPENQYQPAIEANKAERTTRYSAKDAESLSDMIHNFEWYNCVDSETGLYTSFYVNTEDLAKYEESLNKATELEPTSMAA